MVTKEGGSIMKALIEVVGTKAKVWLFKDDQDVAKELGIWYNNKLKETDKIDWKFTDYKDEEGYASISNWDIIVERMVADVEER